MMQAELIEPSHPELMKFKLLRNVLLLAALQSAISPAFAQNACPLSTEKQANVAQLFFGRSIEGRKPLTDAEWSEFAATVLSRYFPDGFTAYDGDGQWFDPRSRKIVRERSKIVVIAFTGSDEEFSRKIHAVSSDYRGRFRQQSVGLITEKACAAFRSDGSFRSRIRSIP